MTQNQPENQNRELMAEVENRRRLLAYVIARGIAEASAIWHTKGQMDSKQMVEAENRVAEVIAVVESILGEG